MKRKNTLAVLCSVPGLLTLSRAVFAAWFPFCVDSPGRALALIIAAGLSDFLDGWYARRFHITSTAGAVLDPITDKLFSLSVVISLVAGGRLSIVGALLLSAREILELPLLLWLVADPRARAIRARELGSNLLGKLTTTLQFAALLCVLLAPRFQALWLGATAITGVLAAGAYWLRFVGALNRSSVGADGPSTP